MQLFSVVEVPGAATAALPSDFDVSVRFVDSDDQAVVLADFTGERSLKASALLPLIPAEDFQELVRQLAPGLLWRMAQEAASG
jgi:hypothetical protein